MTAKFRELFDAQPALIQAPMAGVQDAALAIAVDAAGAVGSLPAAMFSPEQLDTELRKLKAAMGNRFNVNFFAHSEPAPDADADARWREALAPYYAEFGIDVANIRPGPGRAPFSHAVADIVEPYRPALVSFHFGLPPDDLLARVKAWGSRILSSATTVEEARWLEAKGVDAVIAQGLEAGGHRGHFLSHDLTCQQGTFALLPQIVRAVKVPVIATGGIATAEGVAAAMALGASAVQAGTAFMLCNEAKTSALHRAALRQASARHTALTNLFTGRPARGIVNRLMRELGPMGAAAPAFPLATAALAPIRAAAEAKGSGDFSPLWSGQNIDGCRAVPAAEQVRELTRLL
ncbi:MAG: nitronate monooxygenase [Betaproteobacteria bacterium]|nr:nitronate monooxygenase [Betaproteobacteria bacterium]